MSVNKFGKNRSVDSRYYNVPYKYLTSVDGKNKQPKNHRVKTLAEFKEEEIKLYKKCKMPIPTNTELKAKYKRMCELYGSKSWFDDDLSLDDMLLLDNAETLKNTSNRDKTLCIVDFFGKNKAIVGWRNNERCTISMPKICPIVYKKGKGYIIYRGKEIEFTSNGGWVF